MALIITPGPVPTDGQRIRIQQELTAFIQGTDITGFGPDEFAGSPVDFVTSATDPPATDIRGRGTFWFARGEGKLYKWTFEPVASGFFAPSEPGSNITEGRWLAISDRRDIIIKSRWGIHNGEKVIMNTAISEWKFEQSAEIEGESRFTVVCAATAGTAGTFNTGMGFNNALFMTHAVHVDPSFIALEDIVDGAYGVAVDCGFVDTLVQGAGSNGVDPVVAMHISTEDPHYRLKSAGATEWNNLSCMLGMVAESAASQAEQMLQVLFYAASSNIVRPPDPLYNG